MFQIVPSSQPGVTRLFCVPYAGGGPSAFRGWREELQPEVEVTVVQLPGREARFRERPYREMGPLVEDLADSVIPWLNTGQLFAFFGHSLGGLIAFETLHVIRQRTGREASHLFVSACAAPHCEPILPRVGHLDDQELCRAVNQRYGGIPAAVLADEEFLQATLPTLRADICLLEEYHRRPPRPLSCPISAFGGAGDPTLPENHVEAWREQTLSSFERFVLDEGHLFLVSAREPLMRHVRETLVPAACAR